MFIIKFIAGNKTGRQKATPFLHLKDLLNAMVSSDRR
jgi:hypothetical protein